MSLANSTHADEGFVVLFLISRKWRSRELSDIISCELADADAVPSLEVGEDQDRSCHC